MTTIGVDLGGTKILAGVVHDGEVGKSVKQLTPTGGPAEVVAAIADLVGQLGGAKRVGIGAPGQIDHHAGMVMEAPNLVGFDGPVPFADLLAGALGGGVDILLDNDVNVAALGEAQRGARAGHHDLLAVWCGTGVGGGIVLDGHVRRGAAGVAGEIGHITVQPNGRACGCGGLGHLEAYAGRAAMEAEARRRHAAGTPTKLVQIAGEERMKSATFLRALEAGDRVATELIDEAVEALGVGISSVTLVLDVDLVVVGGGLTEKLGDKFVGRVEEAVRARRWGSLLVRVVRAALGDDAGVIGAAALFERSNRAPAPARPR